MVIAGYRRAIAFSFDIKHMLKHLNIEHPTPNIEHPMGRSLRSAILYIGRMPYGATALQLLKP